MSQLTLATRSQPIDAPMALARSLAPIAVAIVFALTMHVAGTVSGAYPTRIMLDCGVAIIAAVSLTIVNGFTGQFSIGHAAFMALGGYASGMITYYVLLRSMDPAQIREIEPSLFGGPQWMLAAACLVGGVVAAVAGWLVGLPSLRLKGDYLAIVTLGFGEIVRVLLTQTESQISSKAEFHKRLELPWWPIAADRSADGTIIKPAVEAWWQNFLLPPAANGALGFADLPKVTNLFWAYLFVGATILIAFRVKYSSYGRALLSIREDEIAAESMGVNTARMKVRAFVLAAFLAGVAGTLYAHQPGNNLSPNDAGFQRSFDIVMMVVLGGLGSISGSAMAACLIIGASEWLRSPTHVWPIGLILVAAGTFATSHRTRAEAIWPIRIASIIAMLIGAASFATDHVRLLAPLDRIGNLFDLIGQSTALTWTLIALVIACAIAARRFFDALGPFAVPLLTLLFVIGIELIRSLAVANEVNLGSYRMVVFALLLILMMIFRPKGLFGLYEVWDYFKRPPVSDPSQRRGFDLNSPPKATL